MSEKRIPRINALLRQERLLREWSQQDLADQLGTTIVTVNRWERGVQYPSPIFRLKLCAIFGKSEEELGLAEKEIKSAVDTDEALEQQEILPVPLRSEAYEGPSQELHSSLDSADLGSLPSSVFPLDVSGLYSGVQTTQLPEIPVDKLSHVLVQAKVYIQKSYLPFVSHKYTFGLFFMLLLACVILSTLWPGITTLANSSTLKTHMLSTVSSGPSEQVLYQTQWSHGLDNWSVSEHCVWSGSAGGEIITDGYNNDLLVAPYTPHTSDYALEASIKRVGYTHAGGDAYGLVVRNSSQTGGYIAGVGIHFLPEHYFIGFLAQSSSNEPEYVSSDIVRSPAYLDTQWHTYRIEVRRSTILFLIDGKYVAKGESDLHMQAGNVGIYIDTVQISLRSFKLIALS